MKEIKIDKDFLKKYNVKVAYGLHILSEGTCDTWSYELKVGRKKNFLKDIKSSIELDAQDPYDDFHNYVDVSLSYDTGKEDDIKLSVSDSFDTDNYKVIGDLSTVKGLIADYNATLK